MSVLSYRDSRVNWIISKYIKKDTLDCNPVIAGGFPLYVHKYVQNLSWLSDDQWESLKNNSFEKYHSAPHRVKKFSDIDIWFLRNNTWSSLLLENVGDKDGQKRAPSSKEFGEMIGLDRHYKSTSWSDSYFYSKPIFGASKEYQVIKKSFSSVKDLLCNFDFINCSVAWYDGSIYYDKDLISAFASKELRYNKKPDIDDNNHRGKIFHAVRSFKYASRYNLSFDSKVSNFIFNTFFSSKEFCNNVLNDKSKSIVPYGNMPSVPAYGSYGTARSAKDVSSASLVENFYNSYSAFLKMPSFKKEWNLYMLDSPYLRPVVRNELDNNIDYKYNTSLVNI